MQVALCPLTFRPTRLSDHVIYNRSQASEASIKKDQALEHLEVGESLDEWRTFKYWTKAKNRAVGSYNIKAPYGMSPYDFDVVLGLFNYLRELHREGELPENGELGFRLSQLARICRVSAEGGKQANRLRSSIFRLNFFSLHSTAEWSDEAQDFGHKTIKFLTVKYLSRLGKPSKGKKNSDLLVLQFDQSFLDLVTSTRVIQIDRAFYDTLSVKHKRHYLQTVRYGWWEKVSPPDLDAEQYAINQIWMTDQDERQRRKGLAVSSRERRSAHRVLWMKRLCLEAETLEYIEPTKKSGWSGEYLKAVPDKASQPGYLVRWKIGKRIKCKKDLDSKAALSSDPLWQRIRLIRDNQDQPPNTRTFHQWVSKYGRSKLTKQLEVIEWMSDNKKRFKKSKVHTLVDRLENDYPPPEELRMQPQQTLFNPAEFQRDQRLQNEYDKIIKPF